MNTLFEILPGSIDAVNCILICEMSNEGFSYAIKNEEQRQYVALAVYQFKNGTGPGDYGNILHEVIQAQSLLSMNFKKVYIVYSFAECVSIPFSLYSSLENENVLNLVHGDCQSNTSVLTDLVTGGGIYNAYRVSAPILNVLQSKFPDADNLHQYSVLLQQPRREGDKLNIIFYPQRIVLKLNKNSRTELLNSFTYSTAEDVSYILLNACKQFEIENVPVEVSGLIEKDSALFKELYKYFETVDLAPLPAGCSYAEEIIQQPSHYFSHIFAVDSCE
ncbi:MAG: DUF3822 family protein [Ginsengibacter sp.]